MKVRRIRVPRRPGRSRPKAARFPPWPTVASKEVRVAVVGNGPSALGYGEYIDGHDFVVRCTSWYTAHRGESGAKCNAWAWFGSPALWPAVYAIPHGGYESWFVLPKEGKKFNAVAHAYAMGVAASHGPFYQIDPKLFALARETLAIQPSTGFLAILMALQRLNPAKMTVVGFDATYPDKKGWDEPYPVRPWKTDGKRVFGHNFNREKELLAASIPAKRFGNLVWTTEIDWIRLT